ncbi:MAG: hypothetical protein AAGB48_02825 [Planctomycetota bacterium]
MARRMRDFMKRNLGTTRGERARQRRAGVPIGGSRRGISSVLAMMLAILVGALAAAMGTVTQGNLRNAATHLHVMRAMQSAETGMLVAQQRLEEATGRFVVSRSEIDSTLGERLWNGTFTGGDGDVVVLAPPTGHAEPGLPSGIAEALAYRHGADTGFVELDGIDAAIIGPAPSEADGEYAANGWVTTPAMPLNAVEDGDEFPTAFQITYAPLANGQDVRAIVTGYDFDPTRPGRPIRRVISQDFRLLKSVDNAIVSQSRILIGKNVHIDGDLGTRYDQVDVENGDPVVIRSDFFGIDAALDTKLDDLFQNLALHDVDGDNRLRVGHPVEQAGLHVGGDTTQPLLDTLDYDGNGIGDGAFGDVTLDGFVDEFDVFISHFDSNGDGRVAIGGWPADGTPAALESPEFALDTDLAFLIDASNPDRNENGITGFLDLDGDGIWDPASEDVLDIDPFYGGPADQILGYRDGFLDYRDRYTKINGQLALSVSAQAWSAGQGDIFEQMRGAIAGAGEGGVPLLFEAPEDVLPSILSDSFETDQNALYLAADGGPFWQQVAENLGVSQSELLTYIEAGANGDSGPRFRRLDPDTDGDGLPDNYLSAYFEPTPFAAPIPTDWYYRPVFENMVFRDVVIPEGVNGLFFNCTFVGVTHVRAYGDNSHVNWSLYGKMESDGISPPAPIDDPLDKSDFDRYTTGNVTDGPLNYDDFPDPPVVNGTTMTGSDRFTTQYSNNLRLHDCLIVGSFVTDVPDNYTHVRNKIQFTGATRFTSVHPDEPDNSELNPEAGDLDEIAKSSLMAPNYSIDIGTFNSPTDQNVRLEGAIVAGVLDARGNTSIEGALLLTFAPTPGASPMVDPFGQPIGNPADFNTSLGYFGPEDGDAESLDPSTLPVVNGVPIVGWDLDFDGIADLGPDSTPSADQLAAGAVPVPFWGYGRIDITFDPEMTLPDGLMLPLTADPLRGTYEEGKR